MPVRRTEKTDFGELMRVLIDADACPVVDLAIRHCLAHCGEEVLCDTAHRLQRGGAVTLVFEKGAGRVDFAQVNRVQPGDLVIPRDDGLASMCLARHARIRNQNGLEDTAHNMDGRLFSRHENKKVLRAGKYPRSRRKRKREQDAAFEQAFERLLESAKCQRAARSKHPSKSPVRRGDFPLSFVLRAGKRSKKRHPAEQTGLESAKNKKPPCAG